jgi:hypothetical protein
MDENEPLKISHDVSQTLQRKIEGMPATGGIASKNSVLTGNLGLADVERAFVHVDYEHQHDVKEEHKPLYEDQKKDKRSLKDILLFRKKEGQAIVERNDEANTT